MSSNHIQNKDAESKVETSTVKLESVDTTPVEEPKKSFLSFLKRKKEVDTKDPNSEEVLCQEPEIKTPFFVLFLIGPEWFWCILAAICSGLSGGVPLAFQAVFGDILSVVGDPTKTSDEVRSGINNLALWLLGIAAAAAVTNGLASVFSGIAATRLGNRLKKQVYGKLLTQEMGYFDIRKVGILVKRISEDTKNIETAYAVKLGTFCQFMCQFVAGLILSFIYSWLLTLVLLCVGPLIMIVMSVIGGTEQIFSKFATKASDKASAKASEVIATMKTVRSMSGEQKELKYFREQFSRATKLTIVRAFFKGLAFFCMFLLIWGCSALAFWFGGILIVDGVGGHKITLADLMKCFGSILFAIMGAALSLPILQEFSKANHSSIEILKIYKRVPKVNYRGGDRIENLRGEFEFKNVNFAYPSRPHIQVLKDFSLSIPVGKTTALVGQSGSGKSTLTSLIEQFYQVQEGEVLLDGKDLYSLDPKWLHQHVGIVTQEPTLFSGTIYDNICYGLPEGRKVSQHEVEEAAKMANAHNFILDFKDGYRTLLGESSGLSGGQKQRIAIARMCLLNPKVILQDESTSALDSESEKLVQNALNKLIEGRTAIVIAHRLSTIRDADQIVVMENGKIMEVGTHDSLLAKGPKGSYYRLAEKQMAFGQLEEEANRAAANVNGENLVVEEVENKKDDSA